MGEGAEGVLFPQGKLWRTSRVLTVSSVRNRAFLKLFVSQKHKAHSFLLISFINQTSYTCAIHKWANTSLVLTNHNPPSKAAWLERGLISCIRPEFIVFFSLSNIGFLKVAVLDIVGEVSAWTLEYIAMFLVLCEESVIRWSPLFYLKRFPQSGPCFGICSPTSPRMQTSVQRGNNLFRSLKAKPTFDGSNFFITSFPKHAACVTILTTRLMHVCSC